MKIGWPEKKQDTDPVRENGTEPKPSLRQRLSRTKKTSSGDFPHTFSKSLTSLFSEKKQDPLEEDTTTADLSAYRMENIPGVLDQYWLTEPFAYVTFRDLPGQGLTYEITEPVITVLEQALMRQTIYILRDTLLFDAEKNPVRKHAFTNAQIRHILKTQDPLLAPDRAEVLIYYIHRDLTGYGPVDPLMHDEALEDISCNGGGLPVYVFHQKYGSLPTSILFEETSLNEFVLKLAQKADKSVSLTDPMIDATLPEGARAQITYSDTISTRGSSFTIRKFRSEPMTPVDLIRYGTYSPEILAYLWLAVENKKSLLVVGGTASGKTSTMNAVSFFVPLNAKIISLEDTRELQLPHRNWLPTRTRELGKSQEFSNVDMFALLRAALRQRPEYIMVGEVRGAEAQTLFQAMNTGHATLSTIHAGNVQEAINRLINDPINVPVAMFGALDIIIVQSIYTIQKKRVRRCLTVHEISTTQEGTIIPTPVFTWDPASDTFPADIRRSKVLHNIAFTNGWTEDELRHHLDHRVEYLRHCLNQENMNYTEFTMSLANYNGEV